MTELHSTNISEALLESNRIEWIDRCKSLAIYLVIFGHFCLNNKYVYAFHMPLFFFLSGYVLNEKKYDFKDSTTMLIYGME